MLIRDFLESIKYYDNENIVSFSDCKGNEYNNIKIYQCDNNSTAVIFEFYNDTTGYNITVQELKLKLHHFKIMDDIVGFVNNHYYLNIIPNYILTEDSKCKNNHLNIWIGNF